MMSWLLGAAVTWASVPAPAVACEQCACEIPWGLRPPTEEQELPRNARFLLDLNAASSKSKSPRLTPESIHWVNVEGKQDVAFTTVAAGDDPLVVWVVSEEPLQAETEYLITVGDGEPAQFASTFKTSALVDESPPEAAVPKVERVSASGACGETMSARIVWREIQDNGAAMPYEPIVRARVGNGSRDVELFLDAKNLVPGRGLVLANPVDQVGVECWRHFGLPFENEEALTVQLTVYDRAGNAQELDPLDVTLSRDPGSECPSDEGDCSMVTGSTNRGLEGTAAMLLLATVGVARARRGRARGLRNR
jgi:hypothetical protein